MRHLTFVLIIAACDVGFGAQPDPPLLQVTSPQRSFITERPGSLVVTGKVEANPTGAAIASVKVNDVPATINADGTWRVMLDLPPGATLVHTVAKDAAGGTATDTRSVLAGERRAPGSNVQGAVGAAISKPAFDKLSNVATNLIKNANLMALIGPLNPVVRAGDENGPDCLYAQAFVDNVTITDAKIALVPAAGGLQISAQLANPRIVGRTRHAVACVDGSSNFEITASSATFSGLLKMSPNGMNGFDTEIANPVIQLPGLRITATNFPDGLLNVLPLEKVIQFVAPTAVRLFVNPMLNDAFGALTEPQQLAVLGKNVTIQVAPRAIAFDASGGTVLLDMKMLMDGGQNAAGFTFTPNGALALAPGDGIALGIADDLANDALAQLTASGLLNINLKKEGSSFVNAKITPTTPPCISADGTDGKLRVIVPDMMVTFLDSAGTPVARAAVNAQIPIAIKPAGTSVSIDLGTPAIAIDDLDDLSGLTMPPESEFAQTITIGTADQAGSIQSMLGSIPLPSIAGIQLSDVSVDGGNGYVLVKTSLK